MKTIFKLILAIGLSCNLVVAIADDADKKDGPDFKTEPVTNNGEKWRIGYLEGGEYIRYQLRLISTVEGLIRLGWIDDIAIPAQEGEQTEMLWQWLSENISSDYLEFVPDGHYTASWDSDILKVRTDELIDRVNNDEDIDLIIAMGTRGGKALANTRHSTPTFVFSASDPVSSEIIESVEDSGFDHIHASMDPKKYERQLRVFHELTNFKKLGVAYEDSVSGRSYSAVDVIESLADQKEVEIVRCFTKTDIPEAKEAEESVIKCFEQLAGQVDAIYVTQQQGVSPDSIPKLVEIAHRHDIATFSQLGSSEVKRGFLVSMSQAQLSHSGDYNAANIAKVFNGADPRQLTQVYNAPAKIAINLKTAEMIGFDPPIVILGGADEIYTSIEAE